MRLAKLALAATALPLAVLMRWDAPVRDPEPERRSAPSAARPAAARPDLVSRAEWGADERLVRERSKPVATVSAVFIHHTGHANDYDCADTPRMLRSLQAEHVRRMGWDDMGYNFVVDRCGTVYEGRGDGTGRALRGAHTTGFNTRSVGIGALGDFGAGAHVPRAMLEAIAAVAAWKLRPGADPHGRVRLVSTNSDSRYHEGSAARFDVITGHRDGFETDCPGDALYGQLPALRDEVARRRW
ncbi:N-acetylmuramoyl-L-alanine amidase [Streptomyces armeniacus]|uniref:N-acetylmuramoyl-L-alanine amidase n=1 Tax=Streptomyces armeniacus TaxID=83291 RepID=A0A345XII1_9ACTN|nr:N-acetylmuramoyl-L-alanine amidase [Streptomyces armeniacus]AXK31447.1 N-acetylmuramoyl-L-alanine amidase [Streptomyces armeniacus]